MPLGHKLSENRAYRAFGKPHLIAQKMAPDRLHDSNGLQCTAYIVRMKVWLRSCTHGYHIHGSDKKIMVPTKTLLAKKRISHLCRYAIGVVTLAVMLQAGLPYIYLADVRTDDGCFARARLGNKAHHLGK